MSPERIQGHEYAYKSDIWSFGLVVLDLATGKNPYTGKSYIEMQQSFANEGSPFLPETYTEDMRDFVLNCLQVNPENRPSSLELLGHPWILKNISKKSSIKKWLSSVANDIIPLIPSAKK